MSHFQNLPHLISSQIFKYFLINTRMPGCYDIKRFGSLLWSCHNWRNIAISHLFEKQKVTITDRGVSSEAHRWPNGLDLPLEPYADMVKTLYLYLALFYNSPSGMTFPDGVLESLLPSTIYSNARLVEVHIKVCNLGPKVGINQESVLNDIGRVIQYLKKAAPNACDLDIRFSVSRIDGGVNDYLGPAAECVRSLITNIPRRKLHICYNMRGCSMDLGTLSDVPPLAHIRIMGWKDDWMFELIRRCAGTLQVLKLDNMIAVIDVSKLIMDSKGNYVVYPNIRQLSIDTNGSSGKGSSISSFSDAAPFPNLQRFICPYNHPFGDAVVFRGSQHSLERLDIILTPEIVEDLVGNSIFTSTSHPKLRQVYIRETHRGKDAFDFENLCKVVLSMAKNAVDLRLYMDNYTSIQPQHFTMGQLLGQHWLQRLSFGAYPLDIEDVLILVESLPNLRELHTGLNTYAPQLHGLYGIQFLNRMIDDYYPLGSKLQTLSISLSYKVSTEELWVLLILATLFSNVRKLQLLNGYTLGKLIKILDARVDNQEGEDLLTRVKDLVAGKKRY